MSRKVKWVREGLDHINIYSKSNTTLGYLLSNWTPRPDGKMIDTPDGPFLTIEGYWAWLGSAERPEWLRTCAGAPAKKYMSECKTRRHVEDFDDRIVAALNAKVSGCTELIEELMCCHLPFAHYYEYNGKKIHAGHEWLVDWWEAKRKNIRDASLENQLDLSIVGRVMFGLRCITYQEYWKILGNLSRCFDINQYGDTYVAGVMKI